MATKFFENLIEIEEPKFFENLIEIKEPVKTTDLTQYAIVYLDALPEKKEGRGKKVYTAKALVKSETGIAETDITFGSKEYASFEKSKYQMVRDGDLVPLKAK